MSSVVLLAGANKPHWVAQMIAGLRRAGVSFAEVDDPGAVPAENDICIDLRDSLKRARSPVMGTQTWYLVIGGEHGGVPAFEEATHGGHTVEVRLVAHTTGNPPRELRFGRFPYASRHSRTMERIAEQCSVWLQQALSMPMALDTLPLAPLVEVKKTIHALDWLFFTASEAVRFTRHTLRYLFEEARWDVGVTNGSVDRFIADPRATWLHWIAKDRREFLADPFLTCAESARPRVLCETYRGGRTSLVAIDLDERFGERHPLLAGTPAASHPYVFEANGEQWLVPEQHQAPRLDAYHFNGSATLAVSWKLDGIAAVDATIVEHEGLWWLFCTDKRGGANYALHVYWSRYLYGPWHPHARNPVKTDVTGARPAGNFFVRDGSLYRPAQDCSGRYGRAVTIQRIDHLTPERFEETCIGRIDASALRRKGAVGVHTLSHGHGWVAVDVQFVRWSLHKPLRLLKERFA